MNSNEQEPSRQHALSSKAKDSDQICVYKETYGRRSVCMVIEYKPSHKLSVYNLCAGLLRANSGSMNLSTNNTYRSRGEVSIPLGVAGAALTQTHDYMVENSLEYSYLKESEPHTLYYHLAEPNTKAEAHRGKPGVNVLLVSTRLEASQPKMAKPHARDCLQGCN